MTKEGQAVYQMIEKAHSHKMNMLSADLSESETNQISDSLALLKKLLRTRI